MDKNDLLNEFPEYQTNIQELKMKDPHFKKMVDQYNEVAYEISTLNTEAALASGVIIQAKKAKLMHLKEVLFSILASN